MATATMLTSGGRRSSAGARPSCSGPTVAAFRSNIDNSDEPLRTRTCDGGVSHRILPVSGARDALER